jgi:hypothetical protein
VRATFPTTGTHRRGNFQPLETYTAALRNLPPSGGGGCHVAILGAANHGAFAGLAPDEVFRDIRASVRGARPVPDSEIRAAIGKAFRDRHLPVSRASSYVPRALLPQRPSLDAGKFLRAILDKGNGAGEADLWELSPVRINWPTQRDAVELLETLFQPADFLFIGGRTDGGREHVRTTEAWVEAFTAGAPTPEHIAPNAMTGTSGLTKDGKESFRADSCVAQFRFAVLEFDQTPPPLRETGAPVTAWPREAQCQFWAGALASRWPIAALIDSGGKSIHAWLAVNATDANEWTAKVEGELFPRFLVPCGVDRACKNEARLSRMAGHFREEKKRWQRALYLNPDAGKVKP